MAQQAIVPSVQDSRLQCRIMISKEAKAVEGCFKKFIKISADNWNKKKNQKKNIPQCS